MKPPEFRNQTSIQPSLQDSTDSGDLNECVKCNYYSSLNAGFCIKYNYQIQGEKPICNSFEAIGKIICPFCGTSVKKNAVICPFCQTSITPSNEAIQKSMKGIEPNYSKKFLAKYDLWKNGLLDMSKRNKQLFFNPNSKSIIEILSPSMEKLYRSLAIGLKPHTFISVYNAPIREQDISDDSEINVTDNSVVKENYEKVQDVIIEKQIEIEKKKRTKPKAQHSSSNNQTSNTSDLNSNNTDDVSQILLDSSRLSEPHQLAIKEALAHCSETDLITNQDNRQLNSRLNSIRINTKHNLQEQGVNTLFITLGLLKWFEKGEHNPIYSPLLFLPVKILRDIAKHRISIEVLEDDLTVNPSLQEKMRSFFSIDFPPFSEVWQEYDLSNYLNTIQILIKPHENWKVEMRVFLDLFSFNKITMYNDLVNNKALFFMHPIIQAIANGTGYLEAEGRIPTGDLTDRQLDPTELFTLIDADKNQLIATQYAERGASIVIRGPPGTGKSQTITNIIAECLSSNKTVLFVAQKMVALEVVKKRLDATGVGEFCLEIHSNKANKMEVLNQIAKSLGTTLKLQAVPQQKYQKYKHLQSKLNQYIESIHTKIGPDGILKEKTISPEQTHIVTAQEIEKRSDAISKAIYTSIFSRAGELWQYKVPSIVNVELPSPLQYTEKNILEILDVLAQLGIYEEAWHNYQNNPWKKAKIKIYSRQLKDSFIEKLRRLDITLKPFIQKIIFLEKKYQTINLKSFKQLDEIRQFFNTYKPEALQLDIELIESAYKTPLQNLTKYFKSEYYENIKKLKNAINRWEIRSGMEHLSEIRKFKLKYFTNGLNIRISTFYEEIRTDFQAIFNIIDSLHQQISVLSEIIDLEIIPSDAICVNQAEWIQYNWLIQYWMEQMGVFEEWCELQIIRQKLVDLGAEAFFDHALEQKVSLKDLCDVFMKTYLLEWIESARNSLPDLKNFNSQMHQKNIATFCDLDNDILKINRYRLCELLFQKRPQGFWIQQGNKSSEGGILSRELMKKRNIKPLRNLFRDTKHYLSAIKPCFLMSPLSVANYLDLNEFAGFFDVVIFDEASQINPEDAIGSILRARQVIMVGDEKQLPPTRFFTAGLFESEDLVQDDVEQFESILDECIGIGLPVLTLQNHYRSKKEQLISFSNLNYYNGNLYTYPEPIREGQIKTNSIEDLKAIEYIHIPNGIYEKGLSRKNLVEADAIAKAIISHFQHDLKEGTRWSLGVIAFSQAQQDAIQNALDSYLEHEPILAHHIETEYEEEFFIKNLENVQGDERDFIYFSIGYAKDNTGKLSLNFGPLNRIGGERRLNVAITRSRYHIKIFCSFLPNEINFSRSNSRGLKDLAAYLQFAYSTKTLKASDTLIPDIESNLIQDIKINLEKQGYTVDRNVGQSSNRIDLAIVDPDNKSRYILGLQCDGGSYFHLRQAARDRERIRVNMFELLGWSIFHVWTLDWIYHKEKVLDEIKIKIKEIKTPKETPISEREDIPDSEFVEIITPPKLESQEILSSGDSILKKQSEISKLTDIEVNPVVEFETTNIIENSVKQSERRTPEFRQQYLKLPGVVEYKKYVKLEKVSLDNWLANPILRNKICKAIIDIEGPIEIGFLYKRIQEILGRKKISQNVKQTIENALKSWQMRIYKNINGFYFPLNYPANLVRITLDPKDESRDFDQISPLELKNAMNLMLDYSYKIELEELFRKTIELFGFQALTPRISALCIAAAHEIVVEKGAEIQGKIIVDLIPPTIPNPIL